MASKYEVNKEIIRAIPQLNVDTGNVTQWELKYLYTYEGFKIEYNTTVEVADLEKPPTDFTKTELKTLTNFDAIDPSFDFHYETWSSPPPNDRVNDFKIDDLED